MTSPARIVPEFDIASLILCLRQQRVILDSDRSIFLNLAPLLLGVFALTAVLMLKYPGLGQRLR